MSEYSPSQVTITNSLIDLSNLNILINQECSLSQERTSSILFENNIIKGHSIREIESIFITSNADIIVFLENVFRFWGNEEFAEVFIGEPNGCSGFEEVQQIEFEGNTFEGTDIAGTPFSIKIEFDQYDRPI